jgi:hypothetical protein
VLHTGLKVGGKCGEGRGVYRTYPFECFLNDELPFKGIPFKGIGTWATMKVFLVVRGMK